ncbi:MAG: hypothetical protein U0941_01265 [Planctomycetaceae bacterium]
MSISRLDPVERAKRYAKSRDLTIEKDFGYGCDGFVLATNKGTAIKAFLFPQLYLYELEIYEYLKKWQINKAHDFHIPELVSSDPGLSVIEMTVVSPPFILDFVSARIEGDFVYDEEWIAQRMDEFEDDWPTVRSAIIWLAQQGIQLVDVHPGNIRCR